MADIETVVIVGRGIDLVGKILVAYTAISVHHRFWKEHKVDRAVFKTMRSEQKLAVLGIALMVIGYAIEVIGFST